MHSSVHRDTIRLRTMDVHYVQVAKHALEVMRRSMEAVLLEHEPRQPQPTVVCRHHTC